MWERERTFRYDDIEAHGMEETDRPLPAMEPMLIMSPRPPSSRALNMGRIACVILTRPRKFVCTMTYKSSLLMLGA